MSCSTITQDIDIEEIYKKDKQFLHIDFSVCENIIYKLHDLITININLDYAEELPLLTKTLLNLCRTKNGIIRKTTLSYVYRHMIAKKKLEKNNTLWLLLQKCPSRNLSGVTVVTVLTSPFPDGQSFSCKHNCYYCPDESIKNGADADMPRSYLKKEPAVARGFQNNWDSILQMNDRLDQLVKCGHEIDKLEIIIEGGTYTEYPKEYLWKYHRDLFWSANTYFDKKKRDKLSNQEEMLINITAKVRIIGICIETRPDAIDDEWIKLFRKWGVTRIQLGVQHTDNKILKKINRGHTVEQAIETIQILKDNCFKIDIHLMPDLPGASPELDRKMFDYVYKTPYLQPDQIKIYPCEVTPYTVIKKWHESGKYKPYAQTLGSRGILDVVKYGMLECPPWIRLPRIVRDIPLSYISGGNMYPNLRQMLNDELKKENTYCKDLRSREIGRNLKYKLVDSKMIVRKYDTVGGVEYFISIESLDERAIFGFIRLRLPSNDHNPIFKCLKNRGLIRELHVYGNLIPVGHQKIGDSQHKGIGGKLLKKAEHIAFYNNYFGVAVISGEGVRNYYKKKGYEDKESFMIKTFILKYCIFKLILKYVILFTILLCLSTNLFRGTTAGTSTSWFSINNFVKHITS
jgi:ELP3 family radical SAM enzyme/protein acetyltransferase